MFITKKSHRSAMDDRQKLYEMRIREMRAKFEREKEELKVDLKEVVRNLVSVSVAHCPERSRWRVVTELDPLMMSLALERGNDKHMISYIADEVKYMVEREIMSCNIQRPIDVGLGRPVHQPIDDFVPK